MNIILVIICILSLFTNCKEDCPTPEFSTYFPTSIGSYWNYEVYDSLEKKYDRISIKVVNKIVTNNKTVYLWRFENKSDFVDTLYFFANADSVSFYEDNNLSFIKWQYKIPLKIGKTWYVKRSTPSDEYSVVSIDKINNFSDSYRVVRHRGSANYGLTESTWVSPNIGIVRRDIYEFNTLPVINQTWNLISYCIKE